MGGSLWREPPDAQQFNGLYHIVETVPEIGWYNDEGTWKEFEAARILHPHPATSHQYEENMTVGM
jgi:hypothetical protein